MAPPSKEEEEKYPETYRKHYWPALQGYKEAVQDVFKLVETVALITSQHLDQHVIRSLNPDASRYQPLEQMIRTSQMSTARSFYYRERKVIDDAKKPSFNFHYDRMNLSACIKDFYYLNGNEIE